MIKFIDAFRYQKVKFEIHANLELVRLDIKQLIDSSFSNSRIKKSLGEEIDRLWPKIVQAFDIALADSKANKSREINDVPPGIPKVRTIYSTINNPPGGEDTKTNKFIFNIRYQEKKYTIHSGLQTERLRIKKLEDCFFSNSRIKKSLAEAIDKLFAQLVKAFDNAIADSMSEPPEWILKKKKEIKDGLPDIPKDKIKPP
jgi:hypothetical protein